ncbi:hypothetical protein DSL64_05075 [Dyadobacter luteus]|uniref:Uncharacterized protein n=1 Tax=Dyadobacter luteus TaxID=2259619 RepID=A0A3D8YGH2_9BACT|nr:hypothetical protein DSL64_05075 [Dyadobacter luteus]
MFGIGNSYCQVSDTLTKRGIIQLGYLSDNIHGESKGAFLQGVEGQVKWFFKAQQIVKGKRLKDVGYFNVGYACFPSANYTLGQFNAGLGCALPILWNAARMDLAIGAAAYHGSVGETKWSGSKIDLGAHAGLSVPIGRRFGLYGKVWIPGAFTMLSDQAYIPPFFISAGIEF